MLRSLVLWIAFCFSDNSFNCVKLIWSFVFMNNYPSNIEKTIFVTETCILQAYLSPSCGYIQLILFASKVQVGIGAEWFFKSYWVILFKVFNEEVCWLTMKRKIYSKKIHVHIVVQQGLIVLSTTCYWIAGLSSSDKYLRLSHSSHDDFPGKKTKKGKKRRKRGKDGEHSEEDIPVSHSVSTVVEMPEVSSFLASLFLFLIAIYY